LIIDTIQIYGFGKLKETTIDLKPGINVIEGLNEAGKSTIMAFIRAIFFGFEINRNPHLRYEPIHGGVFGGAINLRNEKGEQIRIERVYRKKVTGDVKVFLADGSTGDEEVLSQLLGRMNEKIFKQIFTFGLTELQQIEALQDHEINGFIYNSTMGVAKQILVMKQDLQKKRQNLFKSGGKNPSINQTLQELDRIKQQIESIKRKNEKHFLSTQRIIELDQSIKDLEQTIFSRNKELEWLEKVNHYQKYADRLRAIDNQLENEYSNIPLFPENGIQRLEGIEEKLKEYVGQLEEINFKINELEETQKHLQKNPFLAPILTRIELVKDNWRLYQKNDEALIEKNLEFELIQKKIKEQLNELGAGYSEEIIKEMNFSINDKQIAQVLINDINVKQEQLKATHNQLSVIQRQWRELEEDLKDLNYQTLEDNNDALQVLRFIEEKWRELKENQSEKHQSLVKKEGLQQQITSFRSKRMSPYIFHSFSFLLLIFGIFSLLNNDWINGVFVSSLAIGLSFFARQTQVKDKKWIRQQETIIKNEENRINELENNILHIHNETFPTLKKWGLERLDQSTIDQLRQWKEKYLKQADRSQYGKQKKLEIDHLLEEKKLQEEALHQEWIKWKAWLANHHLDVRTEPSFLLTLINKIEQIKSQLEQRDFLHEQKQLIQNKKMQYHQELEELLSISQIDSVGSYEAKLERIVSEKNRYMEIEEKQIKIQDQLLTLKGQFKMLETKMDTEKKNREALFTYAKVKDKEAFFHQQKRYDEYVQLKEEKNLILLGMKSSCRTEEEFERLKLEITEAPPTILQKMSVLEREIQTLNQSLKDQAETKGQLQNQIDEIEGDHSLSHLLQEYAELQAILVEQTKEWMKLTLADHVMDRTMEIYETEKQPLVIQNATTYFQQMTNYQYSKIIAPIGEKEIEVVRRDGQRFLPLFLSRGTIEQLFLSMRFAFIKEFSKESLVPVVLDDIFVNFDPNRLQNAIKAINQFAEDYQVLLFTCHPHVTRLINDTIDKDNFHYYNLIS